MIWNLIESRKAGASARRMLWLAFWGERARGYATAVRMHIPEDEVVAAVRRGISLSDYIRAREAASHAETLEAHAAAGDLFEYTWQRGFGRAHRPAMASAEGKPLSENDREEVEAAPDAGARETLREDRTRTPLEEKVFSEVPIEAVYEHQPH
ncbi:hypothetical protein [Actinomadura madurae]|uniref:hypothetical protein n=2 Tax=Actinomadura madurae TaxID=1993 RepID=UPI0020275522|nr:hypothetical protein [Actinomadura madurae]MCP9951727.1 hypothetical protein [Actinomadura madurae]MCP9980968.1 hypothetical protein [Actinomadura madurae]MCQ0007529.1 hypothetical protein [Actinomadura madurae]URM97224.1 hypothetical protein LUW76_24305 [Actinomadura madurae]URN07990.1 hypothetical protein LUW74_34580 [Actinomadura madurae]